MDRDISRRDFVSGMGVAIGASWLPPSLAAEAGMQAAPGYYPPALTGMRGSHPGSFEVAHAAVTGQAWRGTDTGEDYDLVVVGGGISGLAAAYFYRQSAGSDARILILDNHDDFGGHAKRNEFMIDGRLMLGYGGTQSIEAPSSYPAAAKRLLTELGIDTDRFYTAFDREFEDRHDLDDATFFDKETFGVDRLVVGELSELDSLDELPMSDEAMRQLARLLADDRHYLDDVPADKRLALLSRMSYREYLAERAGIGEEVLEFVQSWPRGVWAIGSDALPASAAWSGAYPGFGDLELDFEAYRREETEPYIFHFPDGNASVARLLVRDLVPAAVEGDDMEDIVTARVDYARLDEAGSRIRLRLNSTAVRVQHRDDRLDGPVHVTYVRDGDAESVSAGKVVLAGFHSMVPTLCPELPAVQREALATSARAPLVYTNVLLRNWSSIAELGMGWTYCPGSFHHSVTPDFPVSLGAYRFPATPDEPMVLHLTRVPIAPGLSALDQFVAGRRELLSTTFETFERNIRDQLGRMLADGGFDPARDIAGITVNRWPHGYAYNADPDSGDVAFEPSLWPPEKHFWIHARASFGNIAIAGSDSASNAMTESAIEEAYRAVSELG